ncbi:hypothetical protein CLM62_22235 [Streptomyces sp. SA15]|uniref:hypothetical protein n=1 Tax=Streptomyces sp. SA15 TaxID=934019 RepID=UPI000BAFA3AD|nr:hypothetical protein [Streptomyces sp. SA15]PAZ14140.1 hypothetical protein CLM62_22235 [Streptomyces sp. SA15]
MDAELMALASTAGTAVVTALTTNVWERTRTAVGSLWRRACPDRAETVEAELLETRELLEAPGADDLAEAVADDWRGKFLRLLAARPDVAEEVRRMLDEVLAPTQTQPAAVVFNASPTGNARVYQAGRDQHITER